MQKHGRKCRTREHVIADLSVNYVERMVLRCGYTVERFRYDYGQDLVLYTYDANGEYENGDVRLQVKATDHPKRTSAGRGISLPIESAHLRHWLHEPMPVFLIVYDGLRDEAYWLYVQRHFAGRMRTALTGETVSVQIPIENTLNEQAVRQFAAFRDNILAQARGVIRHHE